MPAITDEQRADVLRRARAGEHRNQIAKATGVSAGSVTNITKAAGVSFDRTATEQAVRSRKVDLAARRAELELDLLEDARRLRLQLFEPIEYRELGSWRNSEGAGGSEWHQYTREQPVPADQLKLLQAVQVAVNTSQRIADSAGDGDTEDAKAMLVQLFGMLGDQWRQLQAEDP